jgi:hypothetical protein
MDALQPVRAEYQRYRRLVELALDQVADVDLARRLDPGGNSIANLLTHLAGNLRSRFTGFLTTDGEKEWRRRDAEFEDGATDRASLLADWDAAWRCVDAALDDVAAAGTDACALTVTIRRQPLTVLEALLRSVAHVAYHAGQVVLLARAFAGPAWRTLSIARGDSAAYAQNPTRERGPDGAAGANAPR